MGAFVKRTKGEANAWHALTLPRLKLRCRAASIQNLVNAREAMLETLDQV